MGPPDEEGDAAVAGGFAWAPRTSNHQGRGPGAGRGCQQSAAPFFPRRRGEDGFISAEALTSTVRGSLDTAARGEAKRKHVLS